MLQVPAVIERKRQETVLQRERAERIVLAPATTGGLPRSAAQSAPMSAAPAPAPSQPLTVADIAARQEHLRQQRALLIEKRNQGRKAELAAYQQQRQQGTARPPPPASAVAKRTADLQAGRITAEGAQLQAQLTAQQAPAENLAGNQAAAQQMRQALTQQLRRTLTRQMSSNADDLTTQLEQVKFR